MSGVENSAFEIEEGISTLTQRKSSNQRNGNTAKEKNTAQNRSGFTDSLMKTYNDNPRTVKLVFTLLINAAVLVYFIFATLHYVDYRDGCGSWCSFFPAMNFCSGYGSLLVLLILVYYSLAYYYILKPLFGKGWSRFFDFSATVSRIVDFGLLGALSVFVVAYIIYEVWGEWSRLQSLVGIFGLVLFGFIVSNNRTKVNFRNLLCGVLAQFILGLLLIKWSTGRAIFDCIGNKVSTFLNYAREGSQFVYGEFLIEANVFAFTVLPVIFFFAFMVSLLYYLGSMQWFLMTFGWVLQKLLGTTVCESVCAAADIFLGMSESVLVIKPYLKDLTKSEYHAIMTAGFATVSGSVFAAYISFGAEPSHLITASVMAAPASLTFAKLFWPETEESKTNSDNIQLAKSEDSSALDAATKGAGDATALILGIIANLVAFIAFIAFVNGILGYVTMLLGYGVEPGDTKITLEYIFGYIFTPLSWALGIPWDESRMVGEVIGMKSVINEFVAFNRLGELKKARDITLRSSAIATFAICGFANPSSLGIMIGALSSMEPSRRPDITAVALRAFVAGSCVTFMTASIAGLLMTPEIFGEYPEDRLNGTMLMVNNTLI